MSSRTKLASLSIACACSLLAPLVLAQDGKAAPPPAPVERTCDPSKEVAIVVNENVPESVAIGEYYAEKRGIPLSQICRVKTVTGEIMTWPELRKDIFEPLRKFLESRKDVLYIVTVYGVPVKTSEENPDNDGKAGQSTIDQFVTGRDYCAIDREIELLNVEHPIEGWIQSKLFGQDRHLGTKDGVYIVCRLDGPSPDLVRALIDNAAYGEAFGVEGRVLVDVRGLSSPGDGYTETDREMKLLAKVCEKFGMEYDLDEKPEVVDLATRTNQGHYWGWYTGDIICKNPDWRFNRGAVGAHLHSFAAGVLRSRTQTWTGPLIAHGVTGTWGTVYEPLTAGFPDGTLFFDRFFQGYTFGESMEMSNQMTSWMAIFVGDPLYAPYAKGMKEKQAENRELCKGAAKAIADALDAGDTAKADELAKRVLALGAIYQGATDPSFFVREARSRALQPAKKAHGIVAELKKAIDSALAAARAGDAKEAVSLARRALDLSPASFDASVVFGMASVLSGNPKSCVSTLEAASKVASTYEVHYWLGRALRGSSQEKAALAELEAALAIRFDTAAVREIAASLAEQKKVSDALARLEAVSKTNPRSRDIGCELGRVYVNAREWKKAVALLNAAIDDLPTNGAELRDLVTCYELLVSAVQGDGDKARQKSLQDFVAELEKARPLARAQAVKIEEAVEDAARSGEKLSDLPVIADKQPGLPRLKLGNRASCELAISIEGPVELKASVKAASGKGTDERSAEVELVPGIYRIAVVSQDKKQPKAFFLEHRVEAGKRYGLGLDEKLKAYTPKGE